MVWIWANISNLSAHLNSNMYDFFVLQKSVMRFDFAPRYSVILILLAGPILRLHITFVSRRASSTASVTCLQKRILTWHIPMKPLAQEWACQWVQAQPLLCCQRCVTSLEFSFKQLTAHRLNAWACLSDPELLTGYRSFTGGWMAWPSCHLAKDWQSSAGEWTGRCGVQCRLPGLTIPGASFQKKIQRSLPLQDWMKTDLNMIHPWSLGSKWVQAVFLMMSLLPSLKVVVAALGVGPFMPKGMYLIVAGQPIAGLSGV